MDKPSTVVYREFLEALRKLVASTPLPAFVMLHIFRDLADQMAKLEEQQYQKDKAMMNGGKMHENQ